MTGLNLVYLYRCWFTWSSKINTCWYQEPSQAVREDQCISPVYIFVYVDEITNILNYVDKI